MDEEKILGKWVYADRKEHIALNINAEKIEISISEEGKKDFLTSFPFLYDVFGPFYCFAYSESCCGRSFFFYEMYEMKEEGELLWFGELIRVRNGTYMPIKEKWVRPLKNHIHD